MCLQLYTFYNSQWGDLFGLRYTLDRPIVRQQYLGSVFGSILVFCLAIALFWTGFRAYDAVQTSHRHLDPAIVLTVSTAAGTAYATLAMAVTVGLEAGFGSVALLVDSRTLTLGGLLPTAALLGAGTGIATSTPKTRSIATSTRQTLSCTRKQPNEWWVQDRGSFYVYIYWTRGCCY